MKLKATALEYVEAGRMFVLDGARAAEISYDPAPFLDVDGDPVRLVICNPVDLPRVQEAIKAVNPEG